MYHMVHIAASATTTASAESVWALVADAAGYRNWTPMDETSLERPGSVEPDGVGALRRFRTGRTVSREEVVAFEAPRHLGYVLVSGLPLKDYRADVTISPRANGTSITWESRFRGKVPGTGRLYGAMLRVFLRRMVKGLAVAAEATEAERSRA